MVDYFDKLMKFMELIFKPLTYIANKLENQYVGSLRGIAQSLFVVGLLLTITSPLIVYTSLLMLQHPPPYCYIIFGLWLIFIGFILLCEVYVGYTQCKRIIESFSKDFEWNVEKIADEYLNLLKKQDIKKKGN